ncbi:hypothetical protein F66182_3472 [Fusarium sp. NRRL 66182]|nr:hypothetical protein F66182_3472 [Fusarium sp. NRRL 66182]
MASTWIHACHLLHEKCNKASDGNPTRLLHIQGHGQSIKLVPTVPSQTYEYVALSHRWGEPKPASTLQGNIKDRMNGAAVQDLPATFQDAVAVTSQLGYQYLWIDSLCIVQDDETDWAQECPRMSFIFQGAALTIAAPAAKDSSVGFLHRRPLYENPDYKPCTLQYRSTKGRPISTIKIWYPGCHRGEKPITSLPGISYSVLGTQPESVLDNRGWVLQETMLSSRTLYFGSCQMYFECKTLFQNESMHDGENNPELSGPDGPGFFSDIMPFSRWTDFSWWHDFITNYSKRDLTVVTDRLPAISGIIHACQPPLWETYLAGVWKSDIPEGLMWYISRERWMKLKKKAAGATCEPEYGSPAIVAQQNYVAPSWSWASVRHEVRFAPFSFHINVHIEVLSFSTTLVDSSLDADAYGRVKAGYLQVRGKLCKAMVAQRSIKGGCFVWPLPFDETDQDPALLLPDDISSFDSLPWTGPPVPILTNRQVKKNNFCEIYALKLGKISPLRGYALAIVPTDAACFRRVGLLRFDDHHSNRMLDRWFGREEKQEITLV